jgi:anthranilate synthase component 1
VLLESVEGGERIGRWSFVVSDPLWTLTVRGDQAEQCWRDGRRHSLQGNPFDLLREALQPYTPSSIPGLPPVGQLFGFWGYELIRWIEPSVPVHPTAADGPPDGCWMLADSLLVFDQVKRQITAVAYADCTAGSDPAAAYDAAIQRLDRLERRMHAPLPPDLTPLDWRESPTAELPTRSNRSREDFEAAVLTAKDHIAAGDVFQLVISQRLETQVQREPFELYRSLRMVNPSPYMAFFNFGGWHLIGSSPEVMVKAEPLADGSGRVKASLRPIAGTRPRGADAAEDQALEADLLADPKERAEHVMLVDLGRNDLGRVCQPGSVSVSELMVIERYSHVMHIVSEVEGLLDPQRDVWDLLMASFPAGTVSGAPSNPMRAGPIPVCTAPWISGAPSTRPSRSARWWCCRLKAAAGGCRCRLVLAWWRIPCLLQSFRKPSTRPAACSRPWLVSHEPTPVAQGLRSGALHRPR